jgi:hypothetical protein
MSTVTKFKFSSLLGKVLYTLNSTIQSVKKGREVVLDKYHNYHNSL